MEAINDRKAPKANERNTEESVELYRTNVDNDPSIIPHSKAINMVPAPTPRRSNAERSAVQAKSVGLEIPVAKPKITAAIV